MELNKAIETLVELGKYQVNEFTDDKDNVYVRKDFKRVTKDYPMELRTNTLTSIVDYIRKNPDKAENMIIQICSHKEVKLISPLDEYKNREIYITAEALTPDSMSFGYFYGTEEFNIALQARFVDTEDKATVLKIAGNITETTAKTNVDDGIGQTITMQTGVTTRENVVIPSRVVLAPFRTFTEIMQPRSEFVLRVSEGPRLALFEADGGAWKNQAIEDIKKYLNSELPEITILA